MPLFAWKGIDQAGNNVKGTLYANAEHHLKGLLLEQNIALLDCHLVSRSIALFRKQPTISSDSLCTLFERLALLLTSGVELVVALRVIENTTDDKSLGTVIAHLRTTVENGYTLHQAMQTQPTLFTTFIVQLIAAGESTGKLGRVLENLADHLHHRQEIRSQLKQAAFAPTITFVFAACLVIGMIVLVFPYFESLYQSLGTQIPPATRRLLYVSHFVRSWYGITTLVIITTTCIAGWSFVRTGWLKKIFDCITPRMYVVAPLVVSNNVLAFVQTILLYLSSGLSLSTALEQAQQTVPNDAFKDDLKVLLNDITRGKSFSQALAENNSRFIDEQLVTIVHVGESSGTLEQTLSTLQAHIKQDLSARLTMFSNLMAPLLMIILGGIVGGIMVLLYIPVFNLSSFFQH
ncbi:MAG: type II secretion system F family protein [Candidatus Babeliales bacterium]|jgi:type IV pilus assembly protein PilC